MHARRLCLLAILLLNACTSRDTALPPPPMARAVVEAAPSHHLATTSIALLDTPILDDAPPTPTPAAPTPTLEPTAPALPTVVVMPAAAIRLTIAGIDLDLPLLPVGLDGTTPIVPPHDAAWFIHSAAPGQGDNVVVWGHALRFRNAPDIPAPFGRLKEVTPGERIIVYDNLGGAHAYIVTQQIWATPDQVGYILPTGSERLTLVSCIGDRIVTERGVDMSHRLITIATPAP